MGPEQFGRYRLEELIGVGGMGEVFRALDTEKGRTVAVKRLSGGLAADPTYRSRFRREARLVARLAAPHIIPIHDYGEIDGRLFLDMPLVRGVDAARLLTRTGALPPDRAVEIVAQTAEGLDAAHAAGLVHRDVKPSNLLLTGSVRDFVYLIDFGLVHDLAGRDATATGGVTGTLDYMAPECFSGRGDQRVDVYALACVLHELLTATKPFEASTAPGLIYAHLQAPPPLSSAVRPDLPPALDEVVGRGMAKDPRWRFTSAGELAAAARTALGDARDAAAVGAAPTVEVVGRHRPRPSSRRRSPTPGPTTTVGPAATPPRRGRFGPGSGRRLRVISLAVVAVAVLTAGAVLAVPALRSARETVDPSAESVAQPVVPVLAAPRPVGTIPADATVDVDFSPDGRLLYLTDDDGLQVLDATTEELVGTVALEGDPLTTAVSPDGRFVHIATFDPSAVQVVDTGTRSVTATIATPEIGSLVVAADGSTVYGAAWQEDTLIVIDPVDAVVSARVPVGALPSDLVLSRDGRTGYVSSIDDGTVTVVDLATRAVTATVPVGGGANALAPTADGTRLYVADADQQQLVVVDLREQAVVAQVRVYGAPGDVVVVDDRWIYLTDEATGSASVVDMATVALIATVPFGSSPAVVALHPDGRRAYIVNLDDPTVSVIDLGG